MAISPMSSPTVPATADASTELRAAKLAKDQQQMEGAQAIQMIQATQMTPPAPTGAAGGNINIMV